MDQLADEQQSEHQWSSRAAPRRRLTPLGGAASRPSRSLSSRHHSIHVHVHVAMYNVQCTIFKLDVHCWPAPIHDHLVRRPLAIFNI